MYSSEKGGGVIGVSPVMERGEGDRGVPCDGGGWVIGVSPVMGGVGG